MGTRITVLVDDRTTSPQLATEHGLSLWIEHGGHRMLFDTATTAGVLRANAAALGVRLNEAEAVCLSHGHYDHTGGLGGLLADVAGAELYAHPAAFVPKYVKRGAGWQSIGVRVSREELEAAGLRVHLSAEPQEVFPGAVLTGEVEREARLAPSTPHLFAEGAGGPQVDPFTDDQALALRGDDGLIVVSGCAHAGIVNHCRAAQRLMNEERLRAVVGGFHLVGASAELLDATFDAFRDLDAQAIHPCHCTGEAAMKALKDAFPERCKPIATGSVLQF